MRLITFAQERGANELILAVESACLSSQTTRHNGEMNGDDARAYETFINLKKRRNSDRPEVYQKAYEAAGW